MAQFPIITKALARQIEQVDLDYTLSRLGGMQAAAGNPLGVEIRQFGEATAFSIKAWPDFWYGNRVLGLGPTDESYLADIVDFFQAQQLPFRLEIIPGRLNWQLATRLHQAGFVQGSFSAALYGPPQPDLMDPSPQVNVRPVQPDELDLFFDLYQAGFGLPRLNPTEKSTVKAWFERDQASLNFYLATVGNTPAGIAVLYLKEGFGLLADAATLPEFRGQGCQSALIYRRLVDAAQKNCPLLTSFVEFGSTSHHNIERAGLRVAYTKALWWKVE